MTAWSHLPNARHIDQALINIQLLHVRPTPACSVAGHTAWRAVQDVAQDVAWLAAQAASRDTILDAAWNAAWNSSWGAAWDVSQSVILALVVYDYSDRYLTMTADQLRAWSALGTDPAAVLLLPYVTFMEHNTSKELA
jgi:hypothetical protein